MMVNFKIDKIDQKGNTATFAIEPLESGFGHTLGNCMRRVLLNTLEGAAITSVKIDGVHHQFSTISGISEDVIEIILNLKKVRVKLFGDKSVKMKLLSVGKGEVRARDIDNLGGGEIINPEQHIASLNASSAKLNIEITVEKGHGYEVADEKKTEEIGVIPVDATYSPVTFVNYEVEPTRVGRDTNYDKLVIEITTDGTIQPEEALTQTARILSGYFKQIYEPVEDKNEEQQQPTNDEESLRMSVEELDLPVRITNALKAIDVDTVGKLVNLPKNQLLKAKNLGVQSVNLITEKLLERGLSLSEA